MPLWIVCLFSISSFGQQLDCQLSISGKIIDEHDEAGLPFASVLIKELGRGTNADATGAFSLKNLCAGNYTLTFSHIGCKPQTLVIQLKRDTFFIKKLEHHAELLEEITITSQKLEAPASQSQTSLKGLALDRIQGKSLGESLSHIAGVNTLQTGPTINKPIIHGLHSSRILIFNNGIRQEGQEWGSDHAPEIDPFIADQLSVIKGAAAVQYGVGALGGIVLIRPAALPTKTDLGGSLSVVGMSNGMQGVVSGKLEGGIKNLKGIAWRLQGTVKRGGDLKTPNYHLTNTGLKEQNFSIETGYKKEAVSFNAFYSRFHTELGILRSAHIGNLTDLEIALNSEAPLVTEDFSYMIQNPKQNVTHNLLKINGSYSLENIGKLKAVYGFQHNNRKEFDLRRNNRTDRPSLNLNLKTHTTDLSFEHLPWWQHLKGTIGLAGTIQYNRNIAGTGVRPLIPFYNSYTAGIFIIEKWIQDKWSLELGIRYDYKNLEAKKFDQSNNLTNTRLDFNGWTATVGGFYRINKQLIIKSNLGSAFRPPNVSELFSEGLHHAVAAIEEGDINLSSEKAIKWINTLELNLNKILQLEIDAYYNHIQNYIYLEPQAQPVLTIRGAFPVFKYTQTDARLWGIDWSGQFQLAKHFFLRTKGSIIRASDIRKEEDLIFIPSDRVEANLVYALTGKKNLKDWQLSIGAQHTVRQSRVPANIDFAPPPNAYTLWKIEAGGNFAIHKNTLGLNISVQNLLNTRYREYLNRLRYYADEKGRNITLRLKYNF